MTHCLIPKSSTTTHFYSIPFLPNKLSKNKSTSKFSDQTKQTMGNRFGRKAVAKQSTSEIAPYNITKPTTVTLYGQSTDADTCYIRTALLYKPIILSFVESSDTPTTVEVGSETVTGDRETLMQYIETEFPQPRLIVPNHDQYEDDVVMMVALQHKSVIWHMERLVRWVDDLNTRGGGTKQNPMVGNTKMEVKKLGKSFSQLMEVMLEHAQMEERVLFPILEAADRGLSKNANEEHARDLPIMNGTKEDIKSICVLDTGSLVYKEAIGNLSTRLKSLLRNCREHFEKEEKDLLPLMEAATSLDMKKDEQVLMKCVDVMQSTHSDSLRFFLDGLQPHDAMRYMDFITTSTRCCVKEKHVHMMFQMLFS